VAGLSAAHVKRRVSHVVPISLRSWSGGRPAVLARRSPLRRTLRR
jgi:hypothetical protein